MRIATQKTTNCYWLVLHVDFQHNNYLIWRFSEKIQEVPFSYFCAEFKYVKWYNILKVFFY